MKKHPNQLLLLMAGSGLRTQVSPAEVKLISRYLNGGK